MVGLPVARLKVLRYCNEYMFVIALKIDNIVIVYSRHKYNYHLKL